MKRRTLLGAIATGAATSLAGCSSIFGGESTPNDERIDVAGNRTNPEEAVTTPEGGYLDDDANIKEDELEEDIDKVLAAKQSYEIAYSLIYAANNDLQEVVQQLERDDPDFDEAREQLNYARLNTERAIKLAESSRQLFNELGETDAVETVGNSIRNMSQYEEIFNEFETLINKYEQGNQSYLVENGPPLYDEWKALEANNVSWGKVESEIDLRGYYEEAANESSTN